MSALILLGVPDGFPCWIAATRHVVVARQQGHERIRVEKGHTCEFTVAQLERAIAQQRTSGLGVMPVGLIASRRQLEAEGTIFEPRTQTWPGVRLTPFGRRE